MLLDVIVPGPWWNEFTYNYNYNFNNLNLKSGLRVGVPFGKHNGKRAGFICGENLNLENNFEIKEIIELIDDEPVLRFGLWELALWLGKTYLCGTGMALQTILPGQILDGEKINFSSYFKFNLNQEFREQNYFDPRDNARFNFYLDMLRREHNNLILFPEVELAKKFFKNLPKDVKDLSILWPSVGGQKLWDAWREIYSGNFKNVIAPPGGVFAPFNFDSIIVEDEASEGYLSRKAPIFSARSVAGKRALDLNAELILAGRMPSSKTFMRLIKKQAGDFHPSDLFEVTSPYSGGKIIESANSCLPCKGGCPTGRGVSFLKLKRENINLQERENILNLNKINCSLTPDKNNLIFVDINRSLKVEERGVEGKLPITFSMLERTRQELENGRHVLWLLDRKGGAAEVFCIRCGKAIKCEKCGSIMRSEHDGQILKCPRCNNKLEMLTKCPECGGEVLSGKRPGLEVLFNAAERLIKNYKIILHDANKKFNLKAISSPSLIIGTRGALTLCGDLDIGLIAWLDLDSELRRSDYNARFRVFNMLWQSCWRGVNLQNLNSQELNSQGLTQNFQDLNLNSHGLTQNFQDLNLNSQGVTQDLKDLKLNSQGVTQDFQDLKLNSQGVTQDFQDLKLNSQGVTQDFQDLKLNSQGVTQDFQDLNLNSQGVTQDFQDLNLNSQGVTQDLKDLNLNSHGLTQNLQDLKLNSQGVTQNLQDLKLNSQGLTQDLKDLNLNSQGLTQDLKDLKLNSQGVTQDFQDLNLNSQDVTQDFQDLKLNSQGVTQDLKDLKLNSQGVTQDFQDLNLNSHGLTQNFQDLNLNSQGVTQDFQDLNLNSQDVTQNLQDLNLNSHGVTQDFQNLNLNSQDLKQTQARKVLIQTRRENFKFALNNLNWQKFWQAELDTRRDLDLPPFGVLIKVSCKNKIKRDELINKLDEAGIFAMDLSDDLELEDDKDDKKSDGALLISVQSVRSVYKIFEPYFNVFNLKYYNSLRDIVIYAE